MDKKLIKNFIFAILIFLAVSAIFSLFSQEALENKKQISFSELVGDIGQERVKEIVVSGDELFIT